MSNIIDFAELIGAEKHTHEYELNGRVVFVDDVPLAEKHKVKKIMRREDDLSWLALYDTARNIFRAITFRDGEPYTDEWLDGVGFMEYLEFSAFVQNPGIELPKSEAREPAVIRGIKGHNVKLAPLSLGDVRFFGEYAEKGGFDNDDFLLAQLDRAFGKATLEDGSSLPDDLFHDLTERQITKLISFWINRQVETVKKDEPTPETGSKKKTGTGRKRSASSSKPSASAPTPTTPTTSDG
jgi:hypothetical protein